MPIRFLRREPFFKLKNEAMNNISRRTFLQTGALAVAGLAFSGCQETETSEDRIVGLQLWSVRSDMKADPLATLQQLADIGYRYVEHAGYADRKFYGYAPKEFKKILEDLGMKMPSGHDSLDLEAWDLEKEEPTDRWKYAVEDALEVGQEYFISPWFEKKIERDYDLLMQLFDIYNKFGKYCSEQGLKFGYHNDFEENKEFDGKKLYDIIMEVCDPRYVHQQLDIGNLHGEGMDALQVLEHYQGRFELLHVKDEVKSEGAGEMNNGYDSTVLGRGEIPIKKILDAAEEQGIKYYFIEQESYQDLTPMECAEKNFKQMKNWDFKI